jgi:membrane protease YdiL (CAAX protease family)
MTKFNSPNRGILLIGSLLLMMGFAINFQFHGFGFHFFRSIQYATDGWILTTLSHGLIVFIIIIGVYLIGLGRLSVSSLGLTLNTFSFAAIVVAGTWVAGQIIAAIVSILFDHRLTAETGGIHSLSALIAQLLGNSLLEETFFRGYLIAALIPYLRKSIALAVLCSAFIFTLFHIPVHIAQNQPFILLVAQFGGGILFGGLYMRTSNLWLCIGLHSLLDSPALLWSSIIPFWIVTLSVIILCIMLGPRFYVIQQRFLQRVASPGASQPASQPAGGLKMNHAKRDTN